MKKTLALALSICSSFVFAESVVTEYTRIESVSKNEFNEITIKFITSLPLSGKEENNDKYRIEKSLLTTVCKKEHSDLVNFDFEVYTSFGDSYMVGKMEKDCNNL